MWRYITFSVTSCYRCSRLRTLMGANVRHSRMRSFARTWERVGLRTCTNIYEQCSGIQRVLLRSPRLSDSFAQDDFWGPLFVVLAYAVISLWGQFRVRRSAHAKHARPSPMHIGSPLSIGCLCDHRRRLCRFFRGRSWCGCADRGSPTSWSRCSAAAAR